MQNAGAFEVRAAVPPPHCVEQGTRTVQAKHRAVGKAVAVYLKGCKGDRLNAGPSVPGVGQGACKLVA